MSTEWERYMDNIHEHSSTLMVETGTGGIKITLEGFTKPNGYRKFWFSPDDARDLARQL